MGPDQVGTNRVRPEQTGTTPKQSVMDGSAVTRPETTNRSGPTYLEVGYLQRNDAIGNFCGEI